MHQPLPPYLDFDTYLWMEHWNARFTEEDQVRAEMEKILFLAKKREGLGIPPPPLPSSTHPKKP